MRTQAHQGTPRIQLFLRRPLRLQCLSWARAHAQRALHVDPSDFEVGPAARSPKLQALSSSPLSQPKNPLRPCPPSQLQNPLSPCLPSQHAENSEGIDGEALEEEPEEEAQEDEDEADDEPMPVLKRPAAKSSQKQEPKAKANPKSVAKSKAKAKAVGKVKPKAKAKAKAKAGSKDSEAVDKALKSRKSVAYHKAKKEAMQAGMTVEEASEIGKAVTYLHA